MEYSKKYGRPYNAFVLGRQWVFAFIAVNMGYSPILQLALALWTCQFYLQYLVKVMPMEEALNNGI